MKICGFEKLSLVDLDGMISATVFLGGCNFRCPFCHNSDLVMNPSIINAIPEEDIINYLIKRKGIIEAVCVSGGEPTLTKDLPDFLKKLKDLGLYVKLDSNGTNPEVIKSLYKDGLIDYVAMDIKTSFTNYNNITEVNANKDNIKESISFLINSGISYEFRTTLVSEFHTKKDIEEMALMIKGAKKIYLQKFVDNENCIKENLHPVSIDDAKLFQEILKKNVKEVLLRGYE